MAKKTLNVIKVQIKGEKYLRIFQFDNGKASREFWIKARGIPGVEKVMMEDWPTVLHNKADKALADLATSIG